MSSSSSISIILRFPWFKLLGFSGRQPISADARLKTPANHSCSLALAFIVLYRMPFTLTEPVIQSWHWVEELERIYHRMLHKGCSNFAFNTNKKFKIHNSHNTLPESQLHTRESQLHILCQKTRYFRPCFPLV